MDKRTRVFAAMDQKPVDHVPVGFWYHFPGEMAAGDACVKAHLDYVKSVDTDILKIMCDSFFDYPLQEGFRSHPEWKALEPLPENHPFIEEQVDRAKKLVDAAGKDMPVFYNVFAPFSSIRFGAGETLVMAELRRNPEDVLFALNVIAESNSRLTRRLIREAGCDGLYYCVQGGEKTRFSSEQYKKMIAPSDLEVLKTANSLSDYNILHCCGWAGEGNRLENWKDYPVKCVNWAVYVENTDLAEGKGLYGGKTVLGGFESLHREGLPHKGLLYSGTKDEIQNFTKDIICSFGKKGLLLGADCTVATNIDHERIRWVVEAARSL